jgi:hypothetical protein
MAKEKIVIQCLGRATKIVGPDAPKTISKRDREFERTDESGQQNPHITFFVKWDILKTLDEGRDLCCCPWDFELKFLGTVGVVAHSFQEVHQ